ncbi:alpha-L-fucosidase [bacterium]|nr:alpha-L-fucosidase [bacterium]
MNRLRKMWLPVFGAAICCAAFCLNAAGPVPPQDRTAWWQEARFGMFIHWGLYSILGRGEWVLYQEHIPFSEYEQLADRFNPQQYDPNEWVALAKQAGMKYLVLTTRHHDGFCLFDSKVSPFTSAKTAAGRDLIAEFASACHAAGMRMGFYYSLQDWRFPNVTPHGRMISQQTLQPLVDQAFAQIRELLTQYGTVDILWFDCMWPHDVQRWRAQELIDMARSLQPNILINDRAGLPADFATPENAIVAQSRPWESCFCMNRSWGYAPYDRNYKPVHEVLRMLASCTSQNGNLLLNVSPDANGRIPVEQVEILRQVGRWMQLHGRAIYGARPSPVVAPNLGMESRVGDKVYLLIQRWPGSTVPFAWCGSKVRQARLLATGQLARVEQKADRVWLHDLPAYPPDPYLNVIELSFTGVPQASDPAYH